MSNIDKQALREAAKKATPGPWYVHDKPCEDGNYGIDTSDKEFLAEAVVWWGFARQSIWREEDAKYIALANPATVLALLDELEAAERRIADLEDLLEAEVRLWTQRYDCANSRREAAEKRVAEVEAREVTLPEDAEHDVMAPVVAYFLEHFKWDGSSVRWDGRKEYDLLADRVRYALNMVFRRAAGIGKGE